jgi:hypothetical protein
MNPGTQTTAQKGTEEMERDSATRAVLQKVAKVAEPEPIDPIVFTEGRGSFASFACFC